MSSTGRGPYVIYKGISFKNCTITDGDDSTSVKAKKDTTVKSIGKAKWTEKDKVDFIKFYDINGAIKTSKKYNINKATVYSYIYNWKKEFDVNSDTEQEVSQPSFITIEKDDDINRSMMKFSNIVTKYLTGKDLFNTIGYVFINGRFVDEESFYFKLRYAIYLSVLESLDIRKCPEDNNKLIIPDFTKSGSEFRESFIFLDKIYNDKNLRYIENINKLFEKYHESYEAEGFNSKWISLIGDKLSCVFDELHELAVSIITNYCNDIYNIELVK